MFKQTLLAGAFALAAVSTAATAAERNDMKSAREVPPQFHGEWCAVWPTPGRGAADEFLLERCGRQGFKEDGSGLVIGPHRYSDCAVSKVEHRGGAYLISYKCDDRHEGLTTWSRTWLIPLPDGRIVEHGDGYFKCIGCGGTPEHRVRNGALTPRRQPGGTRRPDDDEAE